MNAINEFYERTKKLKIILNSKKIDGLFLYFDGDSKNTTQANLFYFTGIWFNEPVILIILNPECKNAKDTLDTLYCCFPIEAKIPFNLEKLEKNTLDKLFSKFKDKKLILGIDNCFLYSAFVKLKEKYKNININFVNISKDIYKLRSIKSKQEIEKIKTACKLQREIFNDLNSNSDKLFKLTEKQIAGKIDINILEKECTNAFDSLVAANKNSGFIHHMPTNALAESHIMTDFGLKYEHYNSDMTRMIFSKSADISVKKAYRTLEDIQDELDDFIKIDMDLEQITDFAKEYLEKDYSKTNFSNFHSLGHGIGIEVHEAPFFNINNTIKENMVFTLEPGIYEKNKFGVRLEDVVVMGKKRIRRL